MFHSEDCITNASAGLCDPSFERTFNVAPEELPSSTEDSYQYQVLMSLSNFYLMISSKDKLGPYQMYAKLMIVLHCFKWPLEVSYPVVPNGKKLHFYLHVPPCIRAFLCYFGGVGLCVNES